MLLPLEVAQGAGAAAAGAVVVVAAAAVRRASDGAERDEARCGVVGGGRRPACRCR